MAKKNLFEDCSFGTPVVFGKVLSNGSASHGLLSFITDISPLYFQVDCDTSDRWYRKSDGKDVDFDTNFGRTTFAVPATEKNLRKLAETQIEKYGFAKIADETLPSGVFSGELWWLNFAARDAEKDKLNAKNRYERYPVWVQKKYQLTPTTILPLLALLELPDEDDVWAQESAPKDVIDALHYRGWIEQSFDHEKEALGAYPWCEKLTPYGRYVASQIQYDITPVVELNKEEVSTLVYCSAFPIEEMRKIHFSHGKRFEGLIKQNLVDFSFEEDGLYVRLNENGRFRLALLEFKKKAASE